MGTAGQGLFEAVSTDLWDLFDRFRTQATNVLAGLGPEPGMGGTTLDGRLLQALRPDDIAGADPGVTAFIGWLKALLPDPGVEGVAVKLHGFDPGGGQPRGPALVAVTQPPAATVVAALTGAGPTGIAFEIAAIGAGSFGPLVLELVNGWSLAISGDVGGGARLQLPRGGPAQVLDPGVAVKVNWNLQRTDSVERIILGPDSGPHLSLATVAFSVGAGIDSGGLPMVSFGVSLADAQLSLAADVLSSLIGNVLSMPVDLELGADREGGLLFRGGGVRATVPANVNLPGIDLHAVDIAVTAADGGLHLSFGVSLTAGLPGIPLTLTVDGFGADFPFMLGSGGLGVDAEGVRPVLPTGLGVDLSLPALSGGGFLTTTGPGGYGGVLDLDLIAVSVQAFGLLQLPGNGQGLSFVAILSVQFPFPGIQIGFGFSLNGVGGVVAVNRRLDSPSLESAVTDGSADQLLFPVDPASHGPAIVATLGRVFPSAEGHIVVGPMLQIGWGGRILTLTVAVVIDLPSPVQFVIIGRLALALPDPAVPLVLIQATLFGGFELSPTPMTSLTGSLAGSNIAGMPLQGDFFFLVRSGDDAVFVLSIGGFHPRYRLPAGVPGSLKRIQLDLTPPGFPGLRSDSYVAVTSNSVQFGAHLELCDEIAGCGVDGWFYFDALFLWDPTFSFAIHSSAGVAVQVLGETLMGVSFDLILEGPAPWHAHGTGKVELFLFSASLDFDVSWGSVPAALPAPPDLGPVLASSLANPAAWIASPPADDHSMVTLSEAATKLIGEGHSVHPLGQVTVRQRAIPFDIQISRYQNQPIPPQTWRVAAAALSAGTPVTLNNATKDEFPAGEFLNFSEDDKLTRPSFEQFTSGAVLTPSGVESGELRPVDTDFEVVLVPDMSLGVPLDLPFIRSVAEMLLAVDDVHLLPQLWSPQGAQAVVVLSAQPVAAASTATMQVQAIDGAPEGFTATQQAAKAQFGTLGPGASVQIVEQWELAA